MEHGQQETRTYLATTGDHRATQVLAAPERPDREDLPKYVPGSGSARLFVRPSCFVAKDRPALLDVEDGKAKKPRLSREVGAANAARSCSPRVMALSCRDSEPHAFAKAGEGRMSA